MACLLLSLGDFALASLPQDELESLFDAPCDRYGVPKALALAIASQESGMRPLAMNIAGRSILHATKDEALAISRTALRAGLSFDIGVMQINAWWIRRYNLPLEVVLDPRGNVQVGVWILAQEIKRHGLKLAGRGFLPYPTGTKSRTRSSLCRCRAGAVLAARLQT